MIGMKKKNINKIRYDSELLKEMRRYIEDSETFHDFDLIIIALGRLIFGKEIYKKLPKEE